MSYKNGFVRVQMVSGDKNNVVLQVECINSSGEVFRKLGVFKIDKKSCLDIGPVDFKLTMHDSIRYKQSVYKVLKNDA